MSAKKIVTVPSLSRPPRDSPRSIDPRADRADHDDENGTRGQSGGRGRVRMRSRARETIDPHSSAVRKICDMSALRYRMLDAALARGLLPDPVLRAGFEARRLHTRAGRVPRRGRSTGGAAELDRRDQVHRTRSPRFPRRRTSSTTSCRPSSSACSSGRGASTRAASSSRTTHSRPSRGGDARAHLRARARSRTASASSSSDAAGARSLSGSPRSIRTPRSSPSRTRTTSASTSRAWQPSGASPTSP